MARLIQPHRIIQKYEKLCLTISNQLALTIALWPPMKKGSSGCARYSQ